VLTTSFSLLVVPWTENFRCKVAFLGLLDYRRLLAALAENNSKNSCLNFLEIISLICLISGKLKS
jgi:hypothetical protein